MSTGDQDPMLGDEDEQQKYREFVLDEMRKTIEETRAARLQPTQPDPAPVMIGSAGMPGGLTNST